MLTNNEQKKTKILTKKKVITLTAYQKRWLADESRYKIGMLARQTGKTFMGCLEIVRDCLQASGRKERISWYIISGSARQSHHILENVIKPIFEVTSLVVKHLGESIFTVRSLGENLWLPGGSKITALPPNPHTIRGITGHILLDEFAFHHDCERLWASVFPIASRSGLKIRVLSTPNGRDNIFHTLMTKTPGWSRHIVDIDQAIAQGLPRDKTLLRQACGDRALWQREYLLDWNSLIDPWLPPEALKQCISTKITPIPDGVIVIGNDIAIRRDRWATVVLESNGKRFAIRHFETLKNIDFQQQDSILKDLINQYRPIRVVMDQTGIGERSVEEMQRLYGSLIQGCIFTSSRRLQIAMHLRKLVEQKLIAIPDHHTLLEDFRSIMKSSSSTGYMRPLVSRSHNGHGDLFWACAMACDGLLCRIPMYDYKPIVPQ